MRKTNYRVLRVIKRVMPVLGLASVVLSLFVPCMVIFYWVNGMLMWVNIAAYLRSLELFENYSATAFHAYQTQFSLDLFPLAMQCFIVLLSATFLWCLLGDHYVEKLKKYWIFYAKESSVHHRVLSFYLIFFILFAVSDWFGYGQYFVLLALIIVFSLTFLWIMSVIDRKICNCPVIGRIFKIFTSIENAVGGFRFLFLSAFIASMVGIFLFMQNPSGMVPIGVGKALRVTYTFVAFLMTFFVLEVKLSTVSARKLLLYAVQGAGLMLIFIVLWAYWFGLRDNDLVKNLNLGAYYSQVFPVNAFARKLLSSKRNWWVVLRPSGTIILSPSEASNAMLFLPSSSVRLGQRISVGGSSHVQPE